MELNRDIKDGQIDIEGQIAGVMSEAYEKYDEEVRTPGLNIVTQVRGIKSDDCDVADRVTVMKYYTVKSREEYEMGNYERHYGSVYTRTTYVVKPRKFYNEAQVWAFLKHIDRVAGRELEDAEKKLLLRYITKGRQYELVCLIDRTKEFENETMYNDIKKEH